VNHLTANELKTRGISAMDERLDAGEDVIISVRGKEKYVVMSLDKYNQLRELELEMALREARADYAAGRVVSESVDEHLRRIADDV
jgi:PHD/YefM family antitoxin component YafN of YafNO toxin-antitoxin module